MPNACALSLFTFSPIAPFKEPIPSSSFTRFSFLSFPKSLGGSPTRLFRIAVNASGSDNFITDDAFGDYPWDSSGSSDPSVQWVQEDKVTLFTTDGLIQIGGNFVPQRISDKKRGKVKIAKRVQRYKESDYMDPHQVLCLGSLFDIAATNGLDMGRKLCILGFCRSVEMLSDVVEDIVLEQGGEVVCAEKGSNDGGLNERLTMTVSVPFLWGVPPASETLRVAIRIGGGIVEKVYWRWDFL
ncbi:unnamed protein product [Cuscuta epithymum]|uniref:DUF7811 domain-containing protein n=1 Tax=Cuscuta epithymum TaxID=186058 RepID=A0AAV0FSM4_9ASTE|nr:unnamed protein product [Cuscuta epithymum]CAH9138386.1 unnamed protein product [Cuscuta epithymum]